MLAIEDNIAESFASLRAHKLRAVLTSLGLMMGVATLITVMTLIQGANSYVEDKIANLGTNVFQVARTPFTVTDYNVILKSLKYRKFETADLDAVATSCRDCQEVGATSSTTTSLRYGDQELEDVNMIGQTANMVEIDTRAVDQGRYFTETEDQRGANVCLIGDRIAQEFFAGADPANRVLRAGNDEFTVIGKYERLGSVLGQDQDNFIVIPLNTYLRIRGSRTSLTLNIKAAGGGAVFDRAQDEVRLILRARRHLTGNREDDFFIGAKDSYISLWKSISSAFFAVFLMVSGISAVVGGIVIMNVMLVSVTERTKEIGVRRAMGATRRDILRQFVTESVMQCLAGGLVGILVGFAGGAALKTFTSFPAAVETWVALFGVLMSSGIGLFFGIYPALRAANLDPVTALRAE